MYRIVEEWIDNVLEQEIPTQVNGFAFNLYEDADFNWSMEIVAAGSFDPEDADWACDEVEDFGTRENPLVWQKEAAWEEILEEMTAILKEYLNKGTYAGVLKEYDGIGIGFVDGDIEILYEK